MHLQRYYQLPLRLDKILKKEEHATCKLEQSIKQNIHLILITEFEEYRYDATYGCCVWESDFELLPQIGNWESAISQSILETIEKHESRINSIEVKVMIDQKEFISRIDKNIKRVKKVIGINVTGKLVYTNDDFQHYEEIYFSPISLD